MSSTELQPLQPSYKDLFGPEDDTPGEQDAVKTNWLDRLLSRIDVDNNLFVYKVFYFFYFAAIGSLVPYLSLYFKHSVLLPAHFVGIIVGVRPLCLFISAPIQGLIADKYDKVKSILLVALFGFIVSHLAVSIVPPVSLSCLSEVNEKLNLTMNGSTIHENMTKTQSKIHKITEEHDHLHPRQLGNTEMWQQAWLFDLYRQIDPKTYKDSQVTFIVVLAITVLGELIGATSNTLADVATFQNLENRPQEYGKQRLWGEAGWGLTAFITGVIVSQQYRKKNDICPDEVFDIYRPFFYVYGALMAVAIFVATRFKFHSGDKHQGERSALVKGLQIFTHVEYILFGAIAIFLGMSHGTADSFLYMHLVERGANPSLFSALVGIQCISNITLYYGSVYFIKSVGQMRMICVGLLVYALRFYYFSAIEDPWLVLPIEFLRGMCNALVWSALATYVGTPPRIGATLQGLLHGMYFGLGKGMGQIVGGILIHQYGTDPFFRYFALIEFLLFILFALLSPFLSSRVPIWMKLSGYTPLNQEEPANCFSTANLYSLFKGKRY